MLVETILATKGSEVATAVSTETISQAVTRMFIVCGSAAQNVNHNRTLNFRLFHPVESYKDDGARKTRSSIGNMLTKDKWGEAI